MTGTDHDFLLDDEIFIGTGRRELKAATSCLRRLPTSGEERMDFSLMDRERRRSSCRESDAEVSALEPTRKGKIRPRKTGRGGFPAIAGGG